MDGESISEWTLWDLPLLVTTKTIIEKVIEELASIILGWIFQKKKKFYISQQLRAQHLGQKQIGLVQLNCLFMWRLFASKHHKMKLEKCE